MRVTIKEAGGMFCCNAPDFNSEIKCCAVKCMAWRWLPDKYRCPKCGAIFKYIIDSCDCSPSKNNFEMCREGYCGLAGKPIES